MHPVVAVYSTFAQRAFDQVVHDVALQNLPVMFAIDRGGIVGADGATHQGAFDIAFLRMLPNMTVMTPSDENECRKLLTTAYRMATPAAVRYPRGKGPGVEIDPALDTVEIGKSRTVLRATAASGRRVAILAFGSMVWRLEKMARELGATLIDMRFVKPMDVRAVLDAAKSHDLLVTAEEGVIAGGAGSAVMELLAAHGVYAPVLQIGIPDHFVDHGDVESLFADCGMDPGERARRDRRGARADASARDLAPLTAHLPGHILLRPFTGLPKNRAAILEEFLEARGAGVFASSFRFPLLHRLLKPHFPGIGGE